MFSRGTVVHAATHAAPRVKACFSWGYKDSLADLPVSGWGVQQQDCFRSEAPLRVLLVFPMVFHDSWITVFGLGGRVFLPSSLACVSRFWRVLGVCVFANRYRSWSCKRKPFACYISLFGMGYPHIPTLLFCSQPEQNIRCFGNTKGYLH